MLFSRVVSSEEEKKKKNVKVGDGSVCTCTVLYNNYFTNRYVGRVMHSSDNVYMFVCILRSSICGEIMTAVVLSYYTEVASTYVCMI